MKPVFCPWLELQLRLVTEYVRSVIYSLNPEHFNYFFKTRFPALFVKHQDPGNFRKNEKMKIKRQVLLLLFENYSSFSNG